MVGRTAATGTTVAAVVAIAVAAFLPWARSGRVARSAFGLARAADEVGVVRGPLARALFVGLAFLPAAAAAAWVAAFLGRQAVVATLGAVAGSLTIVGAVAVWRAPVVTGFGVPVAVAAGVAGIVGAMAIVLTERKR
jgi:hypothetical protein